MRRTVNRLVLVCVILFVCFAAVATAKGGGRGGGGGGRGGGGRGGGLGSGAKSPPYSVSARQPVRASYGNPGLVYLASGGYPVYPGWSHFRKEDGSCDSLCILASVVGGFVAAVFLYALYAYVVFALAQRRRRIKARLEQSKAQDATPGSVESGQVTGDSSFARETADTKHRLSVPHEASTVPSHASQTSTPNMPQPASDPTLSSGKVAAE
ncbi:hypothetical protein THASP1DRAFT_27459 [Thamnocephalis sphaerospora]|uniref:Uncharacterized protein n=1 Tax=Thamnocephalis sphaerospora TaxID=78915 RepID=A0A4P9XZ62_9FUNG|nr:hypothetical protein THASP1DRAFT_27459 [Thamnocephalis sphaerospora]|eukprot:RKP10750.1 hypothetical protein THASP1DRAFT_27459 [Thamnocephalis sphaerospora]